MNFTIDELLNWASQHEREDWATLRRSVPFRFHVTASGIEYIPESKKLRNVPRSELESFYEEFLKSGSFSPGDYPDRWHKSYSLPVIQRFLRARGQIT